jgi:hypothetical protein
MRGDTRRKVLDTFGVTERSGEPVTIVGLGRSGAWDRFAVGAIRIHFHYTLDEQMIWRVWIMSADVAP